MKIEVEKAMELFRHHDKVKFILTGLGEREYETIEFKEVVDLLEKQIPKDANTYGLSGAGYFVIKCPECETLMEGMRNEVNYCCKCGQAIKW